jgi:hypothetical protein
MEGFILTGIILIIFLVWITLSEVIDLRKEISELRIKAIQLEDKIEEVGTKCGL